MVKNPEILKELEKKQGGGGVWESPNFDSELNLENIDLNITKKTTHESPDKYRKYAKLFLEKNQVYNTKNIKESTYKYIYSKNTIPIPKIGEQIRIRTQQQMNLITIILRILAVYKTINELTIATYTLNREALSIITQLKEKGNINKVNLLIASSYSFRDPKWYNEIKNICIKYKISLTFAWIHIKITLIKTKNNYFQFEGSMNYSTNNMAEQLIFENNKEIYTKDYNFINKIMKNKQNKALEVIC